MNTKNQWNSARRFLIIIVDVLVLNFAMFASFWLKFSGKIPERNFTAFSESWIYIPWDSSC